MSLELQCLAEAVRFQRVAMRRGPGIAERGSSQRACA